jgi:CBS domain-containing protein
VLLLQQWGGGVTALVPLSAVQAVPEEFRFTVRAIDVAVPLEGLPVANPNEPADVVMRTMQEREARWILLVDAGHIVGVANQQLFAAAASGRQRREPGQARPVDLGVS